MNSKVVYLHFASSIHLFWVAKSLVHRVGLEYIHLIMVI